MALPFLVGLAPILYLWAGNVAVVEPGDVLPIMALVIVVTGVAVALVATVGRSAPRVALTVAVAWLPVALFGYELAAIRALIPGVEPWMVALADALLLAGLLFLVWLLPVARVAQYLTVAVAIFCASTLPGLSAGLSFGAAPARSASGGDATGPDIYFLILDGYGREDVLRSWYEYDNSPFLDGLRDRGFYVADRSYSNYSMTYLSVPATLNMTYLSPDVPYDYAAADHLVEDASVIRDLRNRGYEYVALETEFWITANAPLADVVFGRGPFESEFERLVFESSIVGSVVPARPRHEATLNAFEDVASVAQMPETTFTFAHMLVPHPPFMFRADGTVLPYSNDLAAGFEVGPYVEQMRFVNDRVTELIDTILDASDEPPIIVIQGDHGPQAFPYATPAERYWERHGILNAMLVPDSVRDLLYPGITSVNTFRAIFAGLFGEDLPLLEDRVFYNWYVSWDASYPGDHLRLFEVTDLLP
ncbi:MAG TPA: sulfatase-like hydrolase/transferase [Candidatus Limnocylindria bacterium]|nr:sulfatase-like hydrolase/transferase [Candidatus Limnocylindria bacterium]